MGRMNSAPSSFAKSAEIIDFALVTERRYAAATAESADWYLGNILSDDGYLAAALSARGYSSRRVDWADPAIDWSKFRCAVFRTTWDYFHRFDEFSRWLEQVARLTSLINNLTIVRWNMDKHYLGDLERRGVPIVPTLFLERGQIQSFRDLLDRLKIDEAVVKPCVSGAARHTYRLRRANAAEIDRVMRPVWEVESLLIQPFQTSVIERGEASLMMFEGRCSHAVLKRAKPGDFRVQDDHGGTVVDYEPSSAEIAAAEQAIAACQEGPVYGRVDLVRENSGHFAVSELELIEPELWIRRSPSSADRFATALINKLSLLAKDLGQ